MSARTWDLKWCPGCAQALPARQRFWRDFSEPCCYSPRCRDCQPDPAVSKKVGAAAPCAAGFDFDGHLVDAAGHVVGQGYADTPPVRVEGDGLFAVWKCDHCGYPTNTATDVACRKCGAPPSYTCVSCGTLVAGGLYACPRCELPRAVSLDPVNAEDGPS